LIRCCYLVVVDCSLRGCLLLRLFDCDLRFVIRCCCCCCIVVSRCLTRLFVTLRLFLFVVGCCYIRLLHVRFYCCLFVVVVCCHICYLLFVVVGVTVGWLVPFICYGCLPCGYVVTLFTLRLTFVYVWLLLLLLLRWLLFVWLRCGYIRLVVVTVVPFTLVVFGLLYVPLVLITPILGCLRLICYARS
jgi:hypothetical protein